MSTYILKKLYIKLESWNYLYFGIKGVANKERL